MHFVYQNMQKYAFSFINTHTNIQGVTERYDRFTCKSYTNLSYLSVTLCIVTKYIYNIISIY